VEESAPSKTEEETSSSVRVRRAGYVGAPATQELRSTVGKRKKEENVWMMVRTWTNWNLIREPFGTSWP
jgi:hypothetical protein